MDGHKDHIAVLVGQLHYFLHTPIVVLDAHKAAEHTYSVIDVDNIIPYIE